MKFDISKFEVFTLGSVGYRASVRKNSIQFNNRVLVPLGNPKACNLLFNRKERAIALEFSEQADRFKVAPNGRYNAFVPATDFIRAYDVMLGAYDIRLEELDRRKFLVLTPATAPSPRRMKAAVPKAKAPKRPPAIVLDDPSPAASLVVPGDAKKRGRPKKVKGEENAGFQTVVAQTACLSLGAAAIDRVAHAERAKKGACQHADRKCSIVGLCECTCAECLQAFLAAE